MQTNVETKKEYVEPKVAELGNIAEITLTPVDHGSSAPCIFKLPTLT